MRVSGRGKRRRNAAQSRVRDRRDASNCERASRDVARLEDNRPDSPGHGLHRGETRHDRRVVARDGELSARRADRDARAGHELERAERIRRRAWHGQESRGSDAAAGNNGDARVAADGYGDARLAKDRDVDRHQGTLTLTSPAR